MLTEQELIFARAYELNKDLPLAYQHELYKEGERELSLRKNQPRSILLIGGAGYIGCVLTTYLLDLGYQIRCLDALIYEHQGSILPFANHPNYQFIYGDYTHAETLNKALLGISDVIILGGLVGDPITKKYPEESRFINSDGLLQAIKGLNNKGLNKLIFISTCSNYGMLPEGVIADEKCELKPLSLYAEAKVGIEQYILSLKDQVDYCPVILRFATAFGLSSRMRFDLTVNEFTRDLYFGKPLIVYDHETWRPYCHVLDFSLALRRVLEAPISRVNFQVFNAGSDKNNYTKQMLVDLIAQHLPSVQVSYKQHGSDPRNYRVNFSKIRETLYFEPKYSVEYGIKEIITALDEGLFAEVDPSPQYGNYSINYLGRSSMSLPEEVICLA